MRLLRLFVLAVPVTACAPKVRLHVESDTSWSGAIANSSYDGSGNASFGLTGDIVCWSIQKRTRDGQLRAYATVERAIFGTERQGGATTTAEYGVVSGCVEP